MIFFYKILNGLAPKYLFNVLPVSRTGTKLQEINQIWNLANSLSELKVLVTLSFPTALRNGKN